MFSVSLQQAKFRQSGIRFILFHILQNDFFYDKWKSEADLSLDLFIYSEK
jgi:hypothetical protein